MVDLIHGDCLEKMKDIPDGSIDFILTDPPYGTTQCKWDSVIPFEPMWEQLKRIIKTNGAIALFGSEPFSSALRMSNIKMFKYDWIWDKITGRGHLVAKIRPLQQTETISIFGDRKINYYPIKQPQKRRKLKEYSRTPIMGGECNKDYERITDFKYPKNLITISNASQKDNYHPTQKPVKLLEYLLKTYTLENETVLDFTMGSGSTGVACVNLKRNFIGIELDADYFKISQDRIKEAEKKKEMEIF